MKETRKRKRLNSVLTLILSLAMIVTYMPVSMIAYAVDADSQDQIEQQATDDAESSVAEAETPSVVEEESVPNDDADEADAAVADAAETAETAETTESQDAEAAEATEEAEAADGEEVDQAEEVVEAEETAEEEKVFEAGSLDAEGSGYKVTLTYSAEAEIPENATLKVKEIKDSLFGRKYDEYLDQTSDKLGKNVPYARFFDITILDEEGNEVQPATPVKVDIQLGDLDSAVVGMKNVELAAVHFDEESGAEKVDVDFIKKSESVDFSAKSFSVYGVAYTYTVDFYYTPGDEDSTTSYSMEGGSSMMLSDLFAQLGIDEETSNIESITSEALDGTEVALEQRVKIAKQFGGDYKISSLEPFDDWYAITITMNDGTQYVIAVTDAQGTTSTTVDHIDIGVVAAASINIPLAYGDYYDSEGNKILTVEVGEYLKGTGVNENVPISQADLRAATITASCDNASQITNYTISGYTTSSGSSGIEQVRIGGRFYTGTLANPVNYTVTVTKEITLQMQYTVDGVTYDLYDDEDNPVTVTVQAALSSTFNYFDDDNDCPGIRNNSNVTGNVDNGAGMDFVLGTTDDQDTSLTAIEIIKYIVDEDGNVIKTDKGYDFDFEVYQNKNGNVKAPAAWSGEYSGDVDYSGYSKLSDKTLTTSTDGLGLVYDYSVADSALVYIKEGTPAQEIKDSDGNTLKYQSTYIETEYVWRNDSGTIHSNINQSDTLTAIPDVVGAYTSDDYDGSLHNTFLEFYVYNVYGPDTGDLTVSKTVNSILAADKTKEFEFTVTLSDTTISGTYGDMTFANGVATINLKDGESATATGLPIGTTYTVTETAQDGFTTTKTDDTGTISKTESTAAFINTRQTGDLEVSKVLESDLAADADKEFDITVTLSDTSISGTYGDMTFTNGVATVTLKGGGSAEATGLPTGITYTVAETAPDGFTATYSGKTGTISTTKSTATVTNTRDTGDLEVSKTVESDLAADANKSFTFTVTLSDTSISGTFGDMTFNNGVATVNLKGGKKATATGLPTTVTYTVVETADEDFTTEKTGDTGTITTTKSSAAFTNTRETGDLEVSKTVKSDLAADKTKEFTFTVTLGDTTINGEYGGMTFEDGVATFTLKGGDSLKATGLPTDVTYTVTETAADGFTTTYDSNSGTISSTLSESKFTNTRVTSGLIVNKTVVSKLAADADKEFTFTVTLSDTTISGTYGDMTFTNGVATVTLKGGETASATGLPTTITYEVVETAVDGFTTTKTGDTGTIGTTASTADFTNTRETGDLEVSKTVVSKLAADADKEFTFTVTLSDTTISGTFGDMTFTDGVATVTLKGGESASADGLPTTVTYTVVETAEDGFTTESEGDTGTISADETAKAAFTNTRDTGDLEVSKTVVSDLAADADKEFTFTVTLSDTTISGTYGDMTFTDGVATVTLKGGESAKAEGLPTTVEYTVEETAADGFTTESEGDTGAISADEAAKAEFTNTRETGDLKVSKIVVSDLAADKDEEFTFTVTLGDTSISGTYGDMTFRNGVATFTLKGGESATATGLPTDVTYTVAEESVDGFSTEYDFNSGSISTTLSESKFTNTRVTSGLVVNKTVVSDLAADADKEFTFTVTLSDTSISGTYGDMTFTDGVATVKLKGGQSAAAEGLPTTVTYTVVETAEDGFTTEKTGDTGTITEDEASTASFTNTRDTGDLEVSKTVVSDLAADANKAFTFTVTLSDTTISGTYGGMTFTDGVAEFTLKDGETVKAEDLPTTVEYTVEETADEDFTTEKTGDTGAISADEAAKAEFTNTRETGDLEVSKTVESDLAADADKEFTFTVTLSDTSISGEYGDMTFASGVAEFTLKGGETVKATGLPTTVEYTVEETADEDFTTEKTGDTGAISADEAAQAEFTNTRETGDLEISKTVVSDLAADKDQEFTFTVTLSDTTISGTYGEMSFTDGVATVTLKGGETATAEGLPTTVEYTVEETAVDGFTTEKTGDTGVISADETAKAEFTNTRETGDLEVTKTVVSPLTSDSNIGFAFTVTLGDNTISGTYGDMTFAEGVAEFTLKDGETATAEGLPTTVTYTVTEEEFVGFTTEQTGDTGEISTEKSVAEFTNTAITIDIEVAKVWDDAENQDGVRPSGVTVNLLADGEETGKTLTVSETSDWSGSFTGLAKYNAGTEIEYTITENEVAEYTVAIVGDATEGFTVTNTHEPEVTSVAVAKIWDDDDDADGVRPDSIKVDLMANGAYTGLTVTLSEDNNWAESIGDLQKNIAGKEIEYTWEEQDVDEYELTDVSVDGEITILTNTHEPEDPTETPKTGDDNNIGGWLALMLLAGAGASGLYIRRRREDQE